MDSPYLSYKYKQVHNEKTDAYWLQINHITHINKSNKYVLLHTTEGKLGVDETTRVNKTTGNNNEIIKY